MIIEFKDSVIIWRPWEPWENDSFGIQFSINVTPEGRNLISEAYYRAVKGFSRMFADLFQPLNLTPPDLKHIHSSTSMRWPCLAWKRRKRWSPFPWAWMSFFEVFSWQVAEKFKHHPQRNRCSQQRCSYPSSLLASSSQDQTYSPSLENDDEEEAKENNIRLKRLGSFRNVLEALESITVNLSQFNGLASFLPGKHMNRNAFS